jgi:hypothetical protein
VGKTNQSIFQHSWKVGWGTKREEVPLTKHCTALCNPAAMLERG